MQIDLNQILPTVYSDVYEISVIQDILTRYNSSVESDKQTIFNNSNIYTCDVSTIALYEIICGIAVGEGTPLQQRKEAVIAIFQERLPYNLGSFITYLDIMVGKDNYTYNMDYNKYELNIDLIGNTPLSVIDECERQAFRYIPCHIQFMFILTSAHYINSTKYVSTTTDVFKYFENK